MKIMRFFNQITRLCLLLGLIAFIGGCAASNQSTTASADAGNASASGKKGRKAKKEEVYSPVGAWEYEVETPDGGGSGIMRITGEPGTFEVILETDQFGELRVYDLEMTGQSMSGKIDAAGVTAEVEGDFDEDTFSGAIILGDQVFPMEAIRTEKG